METSLSKTLSYFLRHEPGEAGLSMDEHGYVPAEELLDVLRDRGWSDMTESRLLSLVESPDVDRFERKGTWIRATYGHSVDVDLEPTPVENPGTIYHGTSRRAWDSIKEQGLKPRGRQYVHLSPTVEEARRVGRRHDSNPVILKVEPASDGHEFYRAGPVVLTEYVPPEWIALMES